MMNGNVCEQFHPIEKDACFLSEPDTAIHSFFLSTELLAFSRTSSCETERLWLRLLRVLASRAVVRRLSVRSRYRLELVPPLPSAEAEPARVARLLRCSSSRLLLRGRW